MPRSSDAEPAPVLNKRDSPPAGRGRAAIVRPGRLAPAGVVVNRLPPGGLAPWLEYVWIVRWDLRDVHVQEVIPQPVVHVAAEDGRLLVHGVGATSFRRTLRGRGHVVGGAFRAGGFRAFLDGPASRLAHRVVTVQEATGHDDAPVAEALLRPDVPDEELAATFVDWFLGLAPRREPVAEQVADLVALAERDRTIVRAEQLAAEAGVGLRTLQRRFGEHVGIGPKWVIRRFRLLDAAAAAHGGAPVDWAALAADLGFSDQPHLVRAFTELVGSPPAAYTRDA